MAPMFSIINNGEEVFVTVIIPGREPFVAGNTHPNYRAIRDALDAEPVTVTDDELADLFDVSQAVARNFTRLSDRVSVANGRVYFDGDEVDGSCERQIVRFIEEGVGDWQPLVRFMENVAANPTEHSRTQLFDWLNAHEFTITPDGRIVGYKGVHSDNNGGFVSGFSGHAIVDGEEVNGQVPNAVGSVIEMPRSEVTHDPSESCSVGLHVGTFDYARSYARGAMLKVYVNPRDVVSVPTDASGRKVRVSRYEVIQIIDAPETSALDHDPDDVTEDHGPQLDPEVEYDRGYADAQVGRGGITHDTSDWYDDGFSDGVYDREDESL
jgi:hypothetical protein